MMKHSLLLCSLLAACGDNGGESVDAFVPADISQLDATPRETITDTHTLAPGELIEGIMTAGPGDIVGIALAAPTPDLEWNIHGHANGGTQVVYEELDRMTVAYVFQPTAQADWYLLIRNGGTVNLTVELRADLYGAAAWRYQ
ncbi:MAG: hypothetical protein M3680_14825 [Myxococcota bacterium]|nr:hypothetical protein [Myxococcota bacterium]